MHILIADDHELLRDMFVLYLGRDPETRISTAASFDAARALVAHATRPKFDLVLLDVFMPGMDGLRGLGAMLQMENALRVALMSGQGTRDMAEQALALGAVGFVPKSLSAEAFEDAVRRMVGGEVVAELADLPCDTQIGGVRDSFGLSPREMQVLGLLTQGRTNKEIALALDIREPTVKLHVKTVYRKMGASNRTHAAMMAKETGLF
ncbi:response regulator transcription factor [Maribius pontilimi]|uniref:Response regulator transcription factor n=2 Tax=Palleronia pontilimi TaxID=1964209 RepID=A0A934MHJ3_9RHOB|nr:response regulator transcription factor [Palleronia pontilimi]MBJ3763369.1 response regulator transcription factor [Palleronia pontilimi]